MINNDSLYSLLLMGIIIVFFVWSITDPRPIKERLKTYSSFKSMLTSFLLILVLILEIIGYRYLPIPKTTFDPFIILIGLLNYGLGIVLAIMAKLIMKKSWGVPAQHNIKRQNKLVTQGPFQFSRNPIYLGLLFISLGFGLALRSILTISVIVLWWHFNRVVGIEEELLKKHFKTKYTAYMKKVPRWL